MKGSEVVKTLQRAGLTRYEAVVFLNLAKAGLATARELALASGVDRVQTYRALESLEGRGFVEVTLDRPKRYAARAVNEVFDMLSEEKRREVESLEAVRKGLLDMWPKITGRTGYARSVRLQVIKGRAQVYKTIRRLVGAAQREVLAFTTTKGLQRSYRAGINDTLLDAMQRGVKPRLIADVNPGNAALMERIAQRVPLRHVDHQRGRFIVMDRESILTFLIQDEGTIRGEAETALWTNSPDFVRAHVEFFEQVWADAIPAGRRLRALRRG